MGRHERWAELTSARIGLAAQVRILVPAQWDLPSRCEGWRVRDVLGHLVHMAESTGTSMRRELRRRAGKDRDLALQLCAADLGARPVPELCERLERSAASRYNGMPRVALSEVVVHGDDMLRPAGAKVVIDEGTAVAVLTQLRRVNLLAPGWSFHGRRYSGVRLVASDVDWAAGRGPEVGGSASDLMALLANRALPPGALSGPGVAALPG